jgi:branched-chain amino acid transport system permease protein
VNRSWIAPAALVLLLAAIPWLGLKPEHVLLFNLILVYAIFALGFDLSFGLTGMLSLGHAAMFGTGGYALALLTMKLGWPFELALLAAGLSGVLVAGIIGFFALRQTGLFFSLTTLAFAQLLNILANTKLRAYTGGVDGLSGVPRPTLFGIDFTNDQYFSVYILVVFAVLLGASALLRSSPLGQLLKGIRLNEARIEQLGWNTRHYKQLIFMVSGFYAGVAGALVGSLLFYVSPQMLHWTTSGDVLIFTLLGGVGTLPGPVIGVAIFEVLKDFLGQLTQHWYGILGLIFVVFTIVLPTGAMGLLGMLFNRRAKQGRQA